MFQKDTWPFVPVCLSEVVGKDTLAVIESGCCERKRGRLIILDYDAASRWVWQAMSRLTMFLTHWVSKLLSFITFGNLPSLVGVAAVVERHGKILMIARRDGLGLGLPGGIVKCNETVEEALLREVHEETGYEIVLTGLVGIYSGPNRDPRFSCVEIVYSGSIVNGYGRPSLEGGVAWIPKTDLPDNLAFDHEEVVTDYLESKVRAHRAT